MSLVLNNQSSKGNETLSTTNESVGSSGYAIKNSLLNRKIVRLEEDESFQGEVIFEGDRYVRKGYGIYRYPNGDVYEGEWDNDKKHGLGEYIYSDGSVYRGEWKEDMKHGTGTLIGSGHEFEGDWENDELKDAFIFKTNFNGEINFDENDKIRIDPKKKKFSRKFILESDENFGSTNTSSKTLNIDNSNWNVFSENYEVFLKKIENNSDFSLQIELLSFIQDYKNKYEDLFVECGEEKGLCENCTKNNKLKVRFDLECKKFKTFLKLFFEQVSKK
jgi:hypothetical protein